MEDLDLTKREMFFPQADFGPPPPASHGRKPRKNKKKLGS